MVEKAHKKLICSGFIFCGIDECKHAVPHYSYEWIGSGVCTSKCNVVPEEGSENFICVEIEDD